MADISIITLTITRVPNSSSVLDGEPYLKSGITTLQSPHDFATVLAQSKIDGSAAPFPSTFARLNVGGHFIKGKISESVDPATGLTSVILPYHVSLSDSGCSDITVDNAYQKYLAFRTKHASLIGASELEAWYQDYIAANYTTTSTAIVDTGEETYYWWLDHQISWSDSAIAVDDSV
jgi:hypothetical protein